ncbi:MAG: hypothetical protein JWM80_3618 [Cyanobacteria bacterium RYN_339]|nr:hypothetical protein [Cyanobacteria bacterium RYN_339]
MIDPIKSGTSPLPPLVQLAAESTPEPTIQQVDNGSSSSSKGGTRARNASYEPGDSNNTGGGGKPTTFSL